MHLTGTFIERNGSTSYRPANALIRLLNAGLLNHTTCGDPPVFGQTVSASVVTSPGLQVVLSWGPAVDEVGGEKDVQKYVIYRRAAAASAFGDPIASVPAGQSTYQFPDASVNHGDQWVYAVTAEDCGGQFSPLASTSTVTVP